MDELFNKYVVNDSSATLDSMEFEFDLLTTLDGWGKRNTIDVCTLHEKLDIVIDHVIEERKTAEWVAYFSEGKPVLSVNSRFDLDGMVDSIVKKEFYLPAYMTCKNMDMPRVFPYSHFPEYSLFSYIYHIEEDTNIFNFLFVKMLFIMDGKYFKYGCQDKIEYHNRLTGLYLDFLTNYYPKFKRLTEFKGKDKKTYLVLAYKFYIIMRNYINSRMRTIAKNLINLPGEVISMESQERLVYLSDMTTFNQFDFTGSMHEKIKHKAFAF